MDATKEWHRLNDIATRHEPSIRMAVTRALQLGKRPEAYSHRMSQIMVEVCRSTADLMSLEFNPLHPIYVETLDDLLASFDSVMDPQKTRREVGRVIPPTITGIERERRLALSDGLDPRNAVRIELARQAAGNDHTTLSLIDRDRIQARQTRGNIVAVTETNRAVNRSLVALWLANQEVSKAVNDTVYGMDIPTSGKIPWNARKLWVTRRDDRVCSYCDPLDGLRAKLSDDFDTDYGFVAAPPIHPNCRCFLLVTTEH